MKKQYLFFIILSFSCLNINFINSSISQLISVALKNYHNKNFAEARSLLEQAYEIANPNDNWDLGFYLGELYAGDYPSISKNEKLASKYFSEFTNNLNSLILANKVPDIYTAIYLLKKAIELNYYPAKQTLVNAYIRIKQYSEAMPLLKDLILNSNKEKDKNRSYIKLEYLANRNIPGTIKLLTEISSLENNFSTKAKLTLAKYYEKEEDYKKACYWLEQVSKTNPPKSIRPLKQLAEQNIPCALFILGKIYSNQNKLTEAKSYFEKASSLECPLSKIYLTKINNSK